MRRPVARLSVIAAAVALATMAWAPVASAAPAPPDWLLTASDVPAALGAPKTTPDAYDAGRLRPGRVDLCTPATGARPLAVVAPGGWQAMVLVKGRGYREVDEQVRQYAGEAAAATAMARLSGLATQCSGTARIPMDSSGSMDLGYYTNTNTTGTDGDAVWIQVDSRITAPDPQANGSRTTTFTVYRVSGSRLTVTWLYQNGTARTSAAQRSAVLALSADLTERLP